MLRSYCWYIGVDLIEVWQENGAETGLVEGLPLLWKEHEE
jgi:hypothetical protein